MPVTTPANFALVEVRARYLGLDGDPMVGTVTFTPSIDRLVSPSGEVTFIGTPVTGRVVDGALRDEVGVGPLYLFATDDPDVDTTGWTYEVREQLIRSVDVDTRIYTRTPYSIPVPASAAAAGLELSDIAPVPPSSPTAQVDYVVLSAFTAFQGRIEGATPLVKPGPVTLASSFAGGEDRGQPGQFDSTSRLNLQSYQNAQNGSWGETVRHFLMRNNAKAMETWYLPRLKDGSMKVAFDPVTGNLPSGPTYDSEGNLVLDEPTYRWRPVAWAGAHWKANDGNSIHGHWSIEAPDVTGALQTRLEMPFTDQEAADADKILGVAISNLRTNLADFTVQAYSGVLRVGGSNAYNKDILLSASSERNPLGERWKLRATNETESGGNAGTNFAIRRHADNGAVLGTALLIRRADGNVVLGADAALGARLAAVWPGGGVHGFLAQPSATPGSAAAYAGVLTAVGDRLLEGRVAGDASARLVVLADGKLELGDGTNPRDVVVYRGGANLLRTDDSFQADGRVGFGGAPDSAARTRALNSTDATGFYGLNTLAGGNTGAPHFRGDSATNSSLLLASRVTGDVVSRFAQRIDGQMSWGDGTNPRDVVVYRGAADVLKTDDDFEVGTVGKGVIIRSPDGTRYRVTVANGGALSAVAA
jgi:hypothetical protein